MAKVYFKYGAMNSGKSTILLQTAHNYEELGHKVLIAKPKFDTKGNDRIVSRLGISRSADILWEMGSDFSLESFDLSHYAALLVDEAQFLTKKQVDYLDRVVAKGANIPVLCFGLRTDYRGDGFEGSSRLLEIAESLEEIKTLCKCGKKATRHLRRVNGEVDMDGDQIVIDDNSAVEYLSVCGDCFYKEIGWT